VINAKIGRFMKSKGLLSKHNRKTYTGACEKCAEQCGVFKDPIRTSTVRQLKLF
jgi:hypothetical protein